MLIRTLVALTLVSAAVPAAAEDSTPGVTAVPMPIFCSPGTTLLDGAGKQLLHGNVGDGKTMVLTTDPETGQWAVIAVMNGMTCIMAAGDGLTPGALPLPGEPV